MKTPDAIHLATALHDSCVEFWTNGEAASDTSHTVHIDQPQQGRYQVALIGQKTGSYQLAISSYAQDGTPQSGSLRSGVITPGSITSYSVPYSPTTVQFSGSSYTVNEGQPRVDIAVNRSGDTTSSAAVGFATNDAAGLTNCNVFNGIASPRCDYINTLGTMSFAAGETSKSFSIAIVDDSYAEGNETFTVSLNSPSGAALGTQATTTVTIIDNDA